MTVKNPGLAIYETILVTAEMHNGATGIHEGTRCGDEIAAQRRAATTTA